MRTSERKIIELKMIRDIAKTYNTLDYVPQLRTLLSSVISEKKIKKLSKRGLHKEINRLLLESYEGEQVLKYRLFQEFKKKDLVAAYEMKVRNSRVDFLTVNGHTTSYEIKSSLDNLYKLAKQSSDYLSAFELNNIVVHEKHLAKCLEIIPKNFGVIAVTKDSHQVIRKPIFNRGFDARTQISLLSKKELLKGFNMNVPDTILEAFDASQINMIFKNLLKIRYAKRWGFIKQHANSIFPIDIQFFFTKNVCPEIIYS
ncbi:sce7726 family protein [Sphingobacterium chungjuense]|uniref:sce7726 family protein n=1 Tax=Sphingobacterium chungjuense TaxID=2675553 RepID=UPI001409A63D|nr:sce7726 family protein [Sphingobacterium chungjuense]